MSSNQEPLTLAGGASENDDSLPAPPCAMVIFGAAGDLTK